MDLVSFAATKRPTCAVCALPPKVLAEVEAGWDSGVRAAPIVEWLETEHKVTGIPLARIRNHFDHRARRNT